MISMDLMKNRDTFWEAFVVGTWWGNWIVIATLLVLLYIK